jgi:hypothetical protein
MSASNQFAAIVLGVGFYAVCFAGVLLWGVRKAYKEKKGGDGG